MRENEVMKPMNLTPDEQEILEAFERGEYESVLTVERKLAFERMVKKGLSDAREGRVISNEEMERRIKSWKK